MSRTNRKEFTNHRKKKRNELGICNCPICRGGRSGKKDSQIATQKRKFRRWKSNKTFKKGIYTD